MMMNDKNNTEEQDFKCITHKFTVLKGGGGVWKEHSNMEYKMKQDKAE